MLRNSSFLGVRGFLLSKIWNSPKTQVKSGGQGAAAPKKTGERVPAFKRAPKASKNLEFPRKIHKEF